jgi:Ribosomal protein L4
LKDKNISEKALHLSLQKIYTHNQGNNLRLDRSASSIDLRKKLFKQKGTGNARAGNKKTTQRRGGGKAFGPKFHDVSFKVNKKVKKIALISSIVSKSINKALFVFDEEKLDEKNISYLLKKNHNKMIIFVLANLLDNKLVIKFQNYKKLYFISDKSYSVHTALKSDMILFSKKSSIYNSYISSN